MNGIYQCINDICRKISFIERDIIQYKSKSTGDRDYEREKDNNLHLSCDESFDALSLISYQIISFYSINTKTYFAKF